MVHSPTLYSAAMASVLEAFQLPPETVLLQQPPLLFLEESMGGENIFSLIISDEIPTKKSFASKNRVAILAELDKEKRKLLLQNQSSTNNPGASIALARPNVNKDFRDHAEQQHIAANKKLHFSMHMHTPLDTSLLKTLLWESDSSCYPTSGS
ncbi:SOSS complex subunit C [Dendropsophus ebraccatus]|uniref:SOSS complex subunit C n=1 Tax=Dendropsophus ebraccatus TaxID=150705 RepID=UPI0038310539